MGRNSAENLLFVVHTYVELSADRAAIRIISARYPTRREIKSDEEGLLKEDIERIDAAK